MIIRKNVDGPLRPVSMEAIIYVRPDGSVVLASYGESKAKL